MDSSLHRSGDSAGSPVNILGACALSERGKRSPTRIVWRASRLYERIAPIAERAAISADVSRASASLHQANADLAVNAMSLEPSDSWGGASQSLSDSLKRVFGDPFEKNGVTMILVARVRAAPEEEVARGRVIRARAPGAASASVRDRRRLPDPGKRDELAARGRRDRIILGARVLAIVALLAIRAIVKVRAKARP